MSYNIIILCGRVSQPGTALNGDAPKAMVAKRLGLQAKEEEESQGAIQQLNTNVRTLVKYQGCRMNAKAAVPRLQVAFRDIPPPFEKACPQALPSSFLLKIVNVETVGEM